MDEEHVVPASEEPLKRPDCNKLLFPLLAILIVAVGAGAFFLGSQRAQAPSPSPSATVAAVSTEQPSPNGSQTESSTTPSPSPTATATGTPTPAPSPSPSPTPTPTGTLNVQIFRPSLSILIFQITGVEVAVDATEKHGGIFCLLNPDKRKFNFTGTITSNKAGTATYRWEGSDTPPSSPIDISFSSAESKTVTTSLTVSGPGSRSMKLHVTSPNDKSSEVSFKFSCP